MEQKKTNIKKQNKNELKKRTKTTKTNFFLKKSNKKRQPGNTVFFEKHKQNLKKWEHKKTTKKTTANTHTKKNGKAHTQKNGGGETIKKQPQQKNCKIPQPKTRKKNRKSVETKCGNKSNEQQLRKKNT